MPVSRPPLLAEQAFDRLREGLLPGGDLWVLEQLVQRHRSAHGVSDRLQNIGVSSARSLDRQAE